MFRYWVDVHDNFSTMMCVNEMYIPVNTFFGPNNRLEMSYDGGYLIAIF